MQKSLVALTIMATLGLAACQPQQGTTTEPAQDPKLTKELTRKKLYSFKPAPSKTK